MRLWRYHAIPAALLVALATSARAQAPQPANCSECHQDEIHDLGKSAHSSIACTTCHVGHERFPHPKHIPKPQCSQCHVQVANEFGASVHGQAVAHGNANAPDCSVCHGAAHTVLKTHTWEFKKSIPALCGQCHADIAKKYDASIHGQALARSNVDVPVCTTCHREHLILAPSNPGSSVYPTHIRETCGQCHGNVALAQLYGLPSNRMLTYDASFHGMLAREGSVVVANCASCHGIHLILPSSDPRSSINSKNLAQTCGKCHPGAGSRFALGAVHVAPGAGRGLGARTVEWVRLFYYFTIPLTIGLMFLHNAGDWMRKLGRIRFQKGWPAPDVLPTEAPEGEIRMYGFERFLHVLLLISFLALVWTGFALRYPTAWWAWPILLGETAGRPLRGIVHRIAAVVFIAVAGIHFISLLSSKSLRRHWQELWPRWTDARDGLLGFAHNLGLSNKRPQLPEHSYVEKLEYWAVVWGTVIMTLTGLMLWAHNFILRWVPKAFLDLATAVHLYEAILAALAILVWHFFFVIFDPEVYPMDAAWLTGRSPRRRARKSLVQEEPAAPEASEAETEQNGGQK